MSDTFRFSPSGPSLDVGGGAVESVFGRQGDVIAEPGDYATSLVDNDSDLPGNTVSDALDGLAGSDSRANESDVPGATVSDALDFLATNVSPPTTGAWRETFSGGTAAAETSGGANPGNFGDLGWNTSGGGTTAYLIQKLGAVTGAVGVIRVQSPGVGAVGTPGGPIMYLGSATLNTGIMAWSDVSDFMYRARYDDNPGDTNISLTIGLANAGVLANISRSVSFGASLDGGFFTVNAQNFDGGTIFFETTSVPIDGEFHDFVIRRVSQLQIDYLIDGVVVATNTDATSMPDATTTISPFVSAFSNNSTPLGSAHVDIDTFELVPP